MKTEREKILQMLSNGQISKQESGQLLNALGDSKRPSAWIWLYNPVERLGVKWGIIIGFVSVVICALLGNWNLRFNGALDMHFRKDIPEWWLRALEQSMAWPGAAAIVWIMAKCFRSKGRLLDYLSAVGVARFAMAITALVLVAIGPASLIQKPAMESISADYLAIAIFSIVGIVWFLVLMIFGNRYASGLKEGRLAGTLICGLMLAELLSKVILYLVEP